MATFANEGGHVLRLWLWVDARYDPLFGSNGQVTGFDPLFFGDLDTELQYVASNHVYLDLTLFDTSARFVQTQRGVGGRRLQSARLARPIVVMRAVEIQPQSHPGLCGGTDGRQCATALGLNLTGAVLHD